MIYLVEKIDPRSERPDLTDEEYKVESVNSLGVRIEDLTALFAIEAGEVAEFVVEGEPFKWTDPETGIEVTARRA